MSVDVNKAVVQRLYDDLFNRARLAVADELVAVGCISHAASPGMPAGPDGMRQAVALLRAAFPDGRYIIEDLIGEDDRVAARLLFRGTHRGPFRGIASTGRRVAQDGALDGLAARCAAVLDDGGARPPAGEDVAGVVAALAGIVREVAARPGAPPLTAFWRDTFRRMLAGIVRERRLEAALAAGAAPLSPAAHLETARYSIGAPHYLATCFILHAGADDPALPRRLPALAALALTAADVARLANDLRTWPKEEREGTFNSIRAADAALARLMPGLPDADRRAQAILAVERLLAAARGRVRALVAAAPAPLPAAEAGIARLVDFVPALYAAADFHDFGSAPPIQAPVGAAMG